MNDGPKTGLHTSEFWLTLVALVAATTLAVFGVVPGESAMFVIGGVAGVYSIGRSALKRERTTKVGE